MTVLTMSRSSGAEPIHLGDSVQLTVECRPCRSRSCSSPTAERSPCASSARAASSGSQTVAVVAPDDAGSLHARSADDVVEIAGYLHSEEHIRAARSPPTPTRSIPGYGFLAENARLRRRGRSRRADLGRTPAEALRLGGDKLAAKRIAREAGVPVLPGRYARRDRLPPAREGRGRRRRSRDARRSLPGRARRGACRRRNERPRSVRRRNPLLRALPRAAAPRRGAAARGWSRDGRGGRRARLLGAAATPEGARGGAGSCARRRRCAHSCSDAAVAFGKAIGYRERRNGRVRPGRRRVLLPRAERAHPGRAPRDRSRHRPRPRRAPDPHRRGRTRLQQLVTRPKGTRSRFGFMPKIQGHSSLRLAASSGSGFQVTTCYLALEAPFASTSGVEEGDEVGLSYDPMIAKLIAHGRDSRRGARTLSRRPRRDRGRRASRRTSRSCAGSSRIRSFAQAKRRPHSSPEHPPLSPSRFSRRPAPVRARRGGSTSRTAAPRRHPTSTSRRTATGRCTARAPSPRPCREPSSASRSSQATTCEPASRSSSSRR